MVVGAAQLSKTAVRASVPPTTRRYGPRDLFIAGYFEGVGDPSFQPAVESIVFGDGTTWGYE